MVRWHRILGLTVLDALTATSYDAEVEKDLSVQQQFLDILIVRRKPDHDANEPWNFVLPDGLDNLAEHNLLTYKSRGESLTARTLDELLSHQVTYRKIVSPRGKPLPIEQFRMYGLCTRFPAKLHREVGLKQ